MLLVLTRRSFTLSLAGPDESIGMHQTLTTPIKVRGFVTVRYVYYIDTAGSATQGFSVRRGEVDNLAKMSATFS